MGRRYSSKYDTDSDSDSDSDSDDSSYRRRRQRKALQRLQDDSSDDEDMYIEDAPPQKPKKSKSKSKSNSNSQTSDEVPPKQQSRRHRGTNALIDRAKNRSRSASRERRTSRSGSMGASRRLNVHLHQHLQQHNNNNNANDDNGDGDGNSSGDDNDNATVMTAATSRSRIGRSHSSGPYRGAMAARRRARNNGAANANDDAAANDDATVATTATRSLRRSNSMERTPRRRMKRGDLLANVAGSHESMLLNDDDNGDDDNGTVATSMTSRRQRAAARRSHSPGSMAADIRRRRSSSRGDVNERRHSNGGNTNTNGHNGLPRPPLPIPPSSAQAAGTDPVSDDADDDNVTTATSETARARGVARSHSSGPHNGRRRRARASLDDVIGGDNANKANANGDDATVGTSRTRSMRRSHSSGPLNSAVSGRMSSTRRQHQSRRHRKSDRQNEHAAQTDDDDDGDNDDDDGTYVENDDDATVKSKEEGDLDAGTPKSSPSKSTRRSKRPSNGATKMNTGPSTRSLLEATLEDSRAVSDDGADQDDDGGTIMTMGTRMSTMTSGSRRSRSVSQSRRRRGSRASRRNPNISSNRATNADNDGDGDGQDPPSNTVASPPTHQRSRSQSQSRRRHRRPTTNNSNNNNNNIASDSNAGNPDPEGSRDQSLPPTPSTPSAGGRSARRPPNQAPTTPTSISKGSARRLGSSSVTTPISRRRRGSRTSSSSSPGSPAQSVSDEDLIDSSDLNHELSPAGVSPPPRSRGQSSSPRHRRKTARQGMQSEQNGVKSSAAERNLPPVPMTSRRSRARGSAGIADKNSSRRVARATSANFNASNASLSLTPGRGAFKSDDGATLNSASYSTMESADSDTADRTAPGQSSGEASAQLNASVNSGRSSTARTRRSMGHSSMESFDMSFEGISLAKVGNESSAMMSSSHRSEWMQERQANQEEIMRGARGFGTDSSGKRRSQSSSGGSRDGSGFHADDDDMDAPKTLRPSKSGIFKGMVKRVKSAAKGSANAIQHPKKAAQQMTGFTKDVAKGTVKSAASVVLNPKSTAQSVIQVTRDTAMAGVGAVTETAAGVVKDAAELLQFSSQDEEDIPDYYPNQLQSRSTERQSTTLLDRVLQTDSTDDDGGVDPEDPNATMRAASDPNAPNGDSFHKSVRRNSNLFSGGDEDNYASMEHSTMGASMRPRPQLMKMPSRLVPEAKGKPVISWET